MKTASNQSTPKQPWRIGDVVRPESSVAALLILCFACSDAPTSSTLQGASQRQQGDPCTLNAQCQSELCIPAELDGQTTGWRGGMCTARCPESSCDSDARCVTLTDGGYCLPQCTATASCRDGYVCHPEVEACLPDCRLGWDCGPLAECDVNNGLCRTPGEPGMADEGADFGEPCASHEACASALCLLELDDDDEPTGWQDGMCSAPCAANGTCGDDGGCVRLGDHLLCVPSCDAATPCRAGYVCNDHLSGCLPDCRLGWDCGEGFECGSTDGLCQLQLAETAPVGAACDHDYQCSSGICFAARDDDGFTGWTDGSCVAICGSAACGPDTDCAVLDGNAWCLPSCGGGAPCRTGYVCSSDLQVCLPDCRAGWECGDSYQCGTDGQCEPGWPSLAPIGAACDGHDSCASGVCLLQDPRNGASWPFGICTLACPEGCPTGTACYGLGSLSYCLPTCVGGQSACPTGYLCDGTYQACIPDCRLGWSCPSGQSCASSGFCRARGRG